MFAAVGVLGETAGLFGKVVGIPDVDGLDRKGKNLERKPLLGGNGALNCAVFVTSFVGALAFSAFNGS